MTRSSAELGSAAGGTTLSDEAARRARRVRAVGRLLDNSIPIPGTGRRIGLDAVIGLVPGIGDFAGGVLSGYIILEAARAQVPTLTLARMLGNVGIDTLVGVVPAVGDLFDAAWKANTKNVVLLEGHLAANAELPAERRGAIGASFVALVVLAVIVVAGVVLGVEAGQLLWGLVTG